MFQNSLSNMITKTTKDKNRTIHLIQKEVLDHKLYHMNNSNKDFPPIYIDEHITVLKKYLFDVLPSGQISLDASQPWLIQWILNALFILGYEIKNHEKKHVFDKLLTFQTSEKINYNKLINKINNSYAYEGIDKNYGTFFGGPNLYGHLGSNYAAISALICLGIEGNNESIEFLEKERRNIQNYYQYFCKNRDGSFKMDPYGESDIRAIQCILSTSKILNIIDDKLIEGTYNYLLECQCYEGGFSPMPLAENHGGYTYTALATINILLDQQKLNDFEQQNAIKLTCIKLVFNAMKWINGRHLIEEGGFNGRVNKLVDSCYTFWQGAALKICENIIQNYFNNYNNEIEINLTSSKLINGKKIIEFVLGSCQHKKGLFRDRPNDQPDIYHTFYSLSGLSILLGCDLIINDKYNNKFNMSSIHNVPELYVNQFIMKLSN